MAELQWPGQTVPFLEEKFVRLDGSIVDVEVAAASFKVGKESASQVIVHDLTERKRAERELLAAETRFRLLVEQLPAITYMAGFGSDGAVVLRQPANRSDPRISRPRNGWPTRIFGSSGCIRKTLKK